jgi:ElaB/YqjD/DUF883 family membrane-anchored ribosome-binding protein
LTTQELKQSLAQARERVLQDIHVLEQDARAAVDLKAWVQRDPWLWVAGALGVGFLLGVLSSRGD